MFVGVPGLEIGSGIVSGVPRVSGGSLKLDEEVDSTLIMCVSTWLTGGSTPVHSYSHIQDGLSTCLVFLNGSPGGGRDRGCPDSVVSASRRFINSSGMSDCWNSTLCSESRSWCDLSKLYKDAV